MGIGRRLAYAGGIVLAVALLAGASFLLGAAVTGDEHRSYPVLEEDAQAEVAGETLARADLAARYQPITRVDRDLPTPPLLETRFEVVDDGDDYTLLYHRVWADERHPNLLVDVGYRVYRSAVYGFPPVDVERTRVSVTKADGAIRVVEFEGAPPGDYFGFQPAHDVYRLTRQADGRYLQSVTGEAGSRTETVELAREGDRIVQINTTWNHLLAMADATTPAHYTSLDAPLLELGGGDYSRGKYARKSPAGPFTTTPDDRVRAAATGLIFVAGAAGLAAWPLARRRLS